MRKDSLLSQELTYRSSVNSAGLYSSSALISNQIYPLSKLRLLDYLHQKYLLWIIELNIVDYYFLIVCRSLDKGVQGSPSRPPLPNCLQNRICKKFKSGTILGRNQCYYMCMCIMLLQKSDLSWGN